MNIYEIVIKPISGFGTSLKGDTIFGHLCWQAFYDKTLFGMNIDKLLGDYDTNPFLIVSSAFPKIGNGYALKRPEMPLDMLFEIEKYDEREIIGKRKELKNKKWMYVEKNTQLKSLKSDKLYINDSKLLERLATLSNKINQKYVSKKGIKSIVADYTQPHNTINRITGKTGEDQFAPYSVDQKVYIPEIELAIFLSIREDIKINSVVEAFNRIGVSGFGKDSSTGLGRFEVVSFEEIDLKLIGSDKPNALYTLSPSVLKSDSIKDIYFSPFVKFGRHGDILAKSGNPFKNPVIMADEGAVVIPADEKLFNKPYIGIAVREVSKVEPKAVTQGYSLYVPIIVEV